MVVFILERVPATVRGEMSRWLIEPRHGVFIGTVSAMVRDRLWEMVGEKLKGGGALLLYSSPTEQGFTARATGDTSRSLRDCEGLLMVHIPTAAAKKKDPLAARVGRGRATARLSPDSVEASDLTAGVSVGATVGTVRSSARSPAARSFRSRERPLGKTHPLYGPQGPADADEIVLYCSDPDRVAGSGEEVFLSSVSFPDPTRPIPVRWRPVAPPGIFAD
jgi:CRISPR-associated protein Cas2